MHRQDALKLGETDDRLLLLNAWRESQLFTTRERAALAWAEALTQIAKSHDHRCRCLASRPGTMLKACRQRSFDHRKFDGVI